MIVVDAMWIEKVQESRGKLEKWNNQNLSRLYEFYNLTVENPDYPGDFGMGSGEREIGSKSSILPQDPGDLAALLKKCW